MDSRLLADIKQAEGCKLEAYTDTKGFWTIGYGHLLPDQSKDWKGYIISQYQADSWLEDDLEQARARCMHLHEWPCLDTVCRQNALIELEFNMAGKWMKFLKTRQDIYNQNWQAAHDDLLDSAWAKEVGPTRSKRIAKYLLTGEY